jgi:hypothetical protein
MIAYTNILISPESRYNGWPVAGLGYSQASRALHLVFAGLDEGLSAFQITWQKGGMPKSLFTLRKNLKEVISHGYDLQER